jgi:dethiobiotin synthetase
MRPQSDSLAFFMTATDTGVGKTAMTAALILAFQQKGYRVGVVKPIETGINPQRQAHSDTGRLRSLFLPPLPFSSICLYPFPQPLAPLACARKARRTIDLPRIISYIQDISRQYAFLLVEGAGGVLTPIAPMHTMRDLMVALKFPVLVVGRTTLGSVNHVLMTVETLQQAGIKISGVILNNSVPARNTSRTRQEQASSVDLIREMTTVPVFGPVGFEKHFLAHWKTGVESLAQHPEIQRLTRYLMAITP